MRADEHEGDLNSTEVKRANDQIEKRAKEIMRQDITELTTNGAFLRYMGRYIYPALMQNVPVNNGSQLAHAMGKRELILAIIQEHESIEPNFVARVLAARNDYERELSLVIEAKE
jgi:hypothetical protein